MDVRETEVHYLRGNADEILCQTSSLQLGLLLSLHQIVHLIVDFKKPYTFFSSLERLSI
jgi:hypothetical protein